MADSMPKRFIDAWNSHDGASVAGLFAADGTLEDLGLGTVYEGRDAIEAFAKETEQFTSDYAFTLVSEQVSGDCYAVEWETFGTNTGDLPGGIPATKRPYRLRGVSIGRLDADGLIKEDRDYYNMADFLTQVGLLPATGA